MSGHRPFSDLKKGWSPERLAANEARKAKLTAEMVSLEQLREGLHNRSLATTALANEALMARPGQRKANAATRGLRHRSGGRSRKRIRNREVPATTTPLWWLQQELKPAIGNTQRGG